MPKIRKQDNRILGTNYPVRKVNLASRDFSIHLGPFMPFNSGGIAINAVTYNSVIKSNSTIKNAAPNN